MMKKLLLSTAVLTLTAGAALAADLPTRKAAPDLPPPPPPPAMWTGFYAGLNAGATWANSNGQYIGVAPVAADPAWGARLRAPANNYLVALGSAASASGVNSGSNFGFIGGGQIGYNWQFYNSFVAGLEADIQGVASGGGSRSAARIIPVLDSTIGDSFTGVQSVRGSLDYLGTVRGRLGWLAMPNLLLYGTGGLAYGGVSLNTTTTVYASGPNANYLPTPAVGGVNFSNTQVGWTAGGGVEWMFMPNWSLKAEYLYYDLGTVTQNFSFIANDAFSTGFPNTQYFNPNALYGGQVRARVNGNVVRAGVNYHFNWGSSAPVVAKY